MPTTVRSNLTLFLTLAALSTPGHSAVAQSLDSADTPGAAPAYLQSQPAPIERSGPANQPDGQDNYRQPPPPPHRSMVKTSQPAPGIYLSVGQRGSVTTVATAPGRTELRIDSGIANIAVHHPAKDSTLLVDLGGGQLALIKDGFYTFNADTRTARVLLGEAEAFPNTDTNAETRPGIKPVKVKQDHAITFGSGELRAVAFDPFQARADVLPRDSAYNHGDGPAYPAYGFYGYGYPYYYPYYAWDYPYYGWGYPYGYGLGFGLGFGYYGGYGYGRGFYGGGFRGGRR